MPVISSDSLQLAHVELDAGNITPTSPAFSLWRTTGESLTFSPNTSESGELGSDGRMTKPSNVTGMTISGDINFELSKFPALEEAMEGVFAEDWGECPLTGTVGGAIDDPDRITVGQDGRYYLIEKRFPNPAAVPGAVPSAVVADSPGATPTITYTGVAAVGTGAAVNSVTVDGGTPEIVITELDVGDDADAAATKVAADLDALDGVSASAAGGVVSLTTTGSTLTVEGRSGNDTHYYQRYHGASYSVMTINASPNNPVTGTVSIVGGSPYLDRLPLAGATYVSAGSSAVFTAPEVMELSVGAALGLGSHCWTSMTITMDSQNRGIACIGTQGDREVVLGTLQASLAGDVYFSDDAILDALLNNETVGDGAVVLSNADGETYRFDLYGLKPVSGSLAAGGTGQDLTMPLSFETTPVAVCNDGSNDWKAGLILSRDLNTAPTLPTLIMVTSNTIVGNATTVTVTGGPESSSTNRTLRFSYEVDDGGSPNTEIVDVTVNPGDTVSTVIAKIQAAFTGGNDLQAVNATASTVDLTVSLADSLDILNVEFV